MGHALQARLSPFILSAADQANEVQPRSIRVIKVPDYFAEYRDKGDGLASFLGTSIVAKVRPVGKIHSRNAAEILMPSFPACIHRFVGEELCFQIGLRRTWAKSST